MEYNNHLILRRAKVTEKATLKVTIIDNFSENFEKPPKLKRLVMKIKLKKVVLPWIKLLTLTIFW